MAIYQTSNLSETAEDNAELALLALTQQAAGEERTVLRMARGAAEVLALTAPQMLDDPEDCSRLMRGVVGRYARFSYAGFTPVSGIVTCSSAGRTFDIGDDPRLADWIRDPKARVIVNMDGPVSEQSVIVYSLPVFESRGVVTGFITISIPHSRLNSADPLLDDQRQLIELVTFNVDGELLTTTRGALADAPALLPAGIDMARVAREGRTAMTWEDAEGRTRVYTVAVIEPGQVYVMGIWRPEGWLSEDRVSRLLSAFGIPVLMWMASLGVALLAVNWLVTRHLTTLGRQMAMFTATRRLPPSDTARKAPTEILRIQRSFRRMTDALVRDEAAMENAVREKAVLVKEIHHRVKNNLQLISSIINMQIRDAEGEEAKDALRRTQDRVLSMATIHRDLYQTNETGLVDVGHLIGEVVEKTVSMTPGAEDIELSLDIQPVWLFPDQAVPLSLLASEGVVNALKHMPPPGAAAGTRWIKLSFHEGQDRICRLELANHPAEREAKGPKPRRGMGQKLIRAFATQLGATVQMGLVDDHYALTVEFAASDFAPLPGTF
ncbi:sensor histidine kinase [Jannaschia rubra]|uniref:histidine kinase n=1 Tax=Jannaschia rubra TaxID=282197 RepID=A0A0M6XVM5_9RHOB|nr:histidine kinase dimerization/phosphoacceptor domain -containing protein [Jannaschia rubra]CTQ34772.1 putative sensor histidine kinase pdtaS [Jannaschia rubra]SFG70111.1 hypothetical protein SAMN04488517_11169 [Jannaschia rubra]